MDTRTISNLHVLLKQHAEKGEEKEMLAVANELHKRKNREKLVTLVSKKESFPVEKALLLVHEEKLDAIEEWPDFTILNIAAMNGHFSLIERFICLEEKSPLSLYSDDQLGHVLLSLLSQKQYVLANLLLNKRSDVNVGVFADSYALHLLVSDEKADSTLFQKVLDKGKSILTEENEKGETPLLIAINKGHDHYINPLMHVSPKANYSATQLEKIVRALINKNKRHFIKEWVILYPEIRTNLYVHDHLLSVVEEKTTPDISYVKTFLPQNASLPSEIFVKAAENNHKEVIEYFMGFEEKYPFPEAVLANAIHHKNTVLVIHLLRKQSDKLSEKGVEEGFQLLIKTMQKPFETIQSFFSIPTILKKITKQSIVEGINLLFSSERKEASSSEKIMDPVFFTHLDKHFQDKSFILEVTKKFIQFAKTPSDVLSIIQQLEKLTTQIPCFNTRSKTDFWTNSFYRWKGVATSEKWMRILQEAKDKIMEIVVQHHMTSLPSDVIHFLCMPIEGKLDYSKKLEELSLKTPSPGRLPAC